MENVADVVIKRLSWVDYGILSMLLLLSAAVGIYHGCFGQKNKTSAEIFLAKRTMSVIPVTVSLIVSFVSAVSIIGTPAGVYRNGTIYLCSIFGLSLAKPTVAYIYLPVFWNIQVTSANEYLEARFNKPTRILGSILFIIQTSFYLAVGVYAPALALAHVTGLHVHVSVSLVCIVCIFYTTLGGIKAVIWTDVLQATVILGVFIFIITKGTIDQGGFNNILEAVKRGGRDNAFIFDFDPRRKFTFWNLTIGGMFTSLSVHGVSQTQVQRYMSLSRKSMVVKSIWLVLIGSAINLGSCVYIGMILYTKYENCDPLSAHIIKKTDQILPYFVMDSFATYPGIAGLFVASVFSAALSTISSGINALAAIAFEDLAKGIFPKISEKTAAKTSKFLSLYFGVQTFALAFVAEQMGEVLEISLIIFGMLGGPILGLFSFGMFVPMGNSAGAFCGTIISTAVTLWMGIGSFVAKKTGTLKTTDYSLPLTPCDNQSSIAFAVSNQTINTSYERFPMEDPQIVDPEYNGFINEIYSISFMWYSLVGFAVVMVTGCVISLLTGRNDKRNLNPKLLSPLVTWLKFLYPGYDTIGSFLNEHDKKIKE